MESNKSEEWLYNQEKLKEAYDDIRWRLIMNKYAQADGEELLELNKEVKNNPRYQMSSKENKRIFKSINRHFREKKLQSLAKKSQKVFTRIAVIFLLFAMIFTITYTSVEAFRVRVLNFILTVEDEYTSLKFENSETGGITVAGFKNIYAPTYIPEGYRIDNITITVNLKMIAYINDEEKFIKFYEYDSSHIINLDTENAEMVKSIKINGADGILAIKNEITTVSWAYDNKLFVIYAQLIEDEILHIAESVICIK